MNPPATPSTQSRPPARRFQKALFAAAAMATGLALVYAIENWRGRRAWAECKAELEAKGEKLDWEAHRPPAILDDQDFLKAPQMEMWFSRKWQVTHEEIPPGNFPRAGKGLRMIPPTNLFHLVWPPVEAWSFPITIEAARQLPLLTPDIMSSSALKALFAQANSPINLTSTNASLNEIVATLAASAGLRVEWSRPAFERYQPQWNGRTNVYRGTANLAALPAGDAFVALLQETLLAARRTSENSILIVSDRTITSLRDWFDRNEPQFAVLREACKRPHARWTFDANSPLDSDYPNFVRTRTIAQALVSRANLNLLLGQPDRAWDDVRIILRLNHYLNECPMLVTSMIGVALVGLCNDTIRSGIEAGLWQDGQLVAIQSALREINLVGQVADSLRVFEQAGMVCSFERSPEDVVRRMELKSVFAGKDPHGSKVKTEHTWLMFAGPRGWIYQNLTAFCRLQQQGIESIDSQRRRVDPARVARFEQSLKATGQRTPMPWNFFSLSVAHSAKALQVTARNQTFVEQARIACALERFRIAGGSYPRALEELVPRFIDGIPADPFTDKPMPYRRTETGYVLWSVGWDQKDENGTPLLDKNGKPTIEYTRGDWAWTQLLPQFRAKAEATFE